MTLPVDAALGMAHLGGALHIAGQIRVDRWQGRESVQMIIDDAAAVT